MPSVRIPFTPIDFKTRFPALDGVRALAVTMVFLGHYGGGTHGGFILRILNTIRLRGNAGVDIFFVLSGFLITGILFDTRNDSRFFQRFFARRSVRIFPVVYLLFAVIGILTPVFKYQWQWKQMFFFIYLGNFFANADFSLYTFDSLNHPAASAEIGHLWSLCVEEQFYFVWPVVVWLLRDRVKLLWTSVALCVVAVLLRIAIVATIAPVLAERWITRSLPFRLDGLLYGAILALLLRGPNADRIQRLMKWIFAAGFLAFILTVRFSPGFDTPWMLTAGLCFTGVASVGLIGMTLQPGSPAFRVFHLRPARVLGKYSYGFYIWHVVWAQAWLQALIYLEHRTRSLAIAGLIILPAAFATSFLAAKISYDFFEVRFLKLKRHFEYDSELETQRTAFAPDGN